MSDKFKFQPNSKYFTISVYSIITCLIIALIFKTIFFWSSTSEAVGNLLSTLSPFLIGILIAFLINPLVNWIRNTVLIKWLHIRNRALNRLLAIFISYFIVVSVAIVGFIYIIPEFINSLSLLIEQIPSWGKSVTGFVNKLADRHPEMDFNYVRKLIDNADSTVQKYLSDFLKSTTATIYVTGVSIIKFIFNLIVAIIVSCYLLIDKKMTSRSIRRIIYAFFEKERAERISRVLRSTITTFSNFFDGKMIDSLIIGILCFVSMMIISLFDIEGFASCALLVSIIVCITNMIPYFGPFIGGIPCTLLLLIYSPKSALIFAILIIVIQQLDGNVIGPKILGDSTGLRPMWIIFAITIGGWCAGVAGMLLGVPCVAVISGLLEETVNARLAKKNIDMPVIENEKVRQNKKPDDNKSKKEK
ncbi:MAG: AI-2E family transporter [Lachnospiraceae bacterium]|nr:AI-2E family transporter [Lachnospiraceae bacterium]